ncbi:MAG: hypothetical protein ACE5DU_01910 [Nitrosopumilus sp.]
MLVKCGINPLEYDTISNTVTLVPRLEYSVNLLSEIISILDARVTNLKISNKGLVIYFDESNKTHLKSIELEMTLSYSLEMLIQIRKRITSISGINKIPEIFPSSIPVMRTISAKLFDILPNCSHKLSELSVHLGSIVLDSATLTKARFDFSLSNHESSKFQDEVKLMVDSKISKQYPNVDFFKLCNT